MFVIPPLVTVLTVQPSAVLFMPSLFLFRVDNGFGSSLEPHRP